MDYYEIKRNYTDFRVTEIASLDLSGGEYHCYLLYKCGLRTIDAVQLISEKLGIPKTDISYAGLKDEDAVTSQFITIHHQRTDMLTYTDTENHFFRMHYVGSSPDKMRIGRLYGNAFSILLRNLSDSDAEKLLKNQKRMFFILNYYGEQRFGMPEKPKLTHFIGKRFIDQDFSSALQYMFQSGNLSLEQYISWKTHPLDYIQQMDGRERNFYLSAWDSYVWNTAVMEIVENIAKCKEKIKIQGIPYLFSVLNTEAEEKLQQLKIIRHYYSEDNKITEKESFRQPYLPIMYQAAQMQEDDYHPGKYMVTIDFTLPSGSYATMAVAQIMWNIHHTHPVS